METLKRHHSALVKADYDRGVDVLYIGRGARVPAEGEGIPGGVELDYTLADATPCGATIIGYRRSGWPERLGELTRIVAEHLCVLPERVAEAIRAAGV